MQSTIFFFTKELADQYALKTLCDYVSKNMSAEIFFSSSEESISGKRRQFPAEAHMNLGISTLSDISGHQAVEECEKSLAVDIAILKNCAVPFSQKHKAELREKYKVKTSKPVVVIGFANALHWVDWGSKLEELVEVLSSHARTYLIGRAYGQNTFVKNKYDVNFVEQWGVLKDYYALADASIDGDNIANFSYMLEKAMHNFVEATEGGPLFFLEPKNPHQYGYKTLVENSVIKEHDSFQNLMDNLVDHLKNFTDNREHCAKRREHILKTRQKYLPVIAARIKKLLGRQVKIHKSDLKFFQSFYEGLNSSHYYLLHPDSVW